MAVAPGPVTLRTLPLYLVGNRQAILSLAASRGTVWLGMLLVFSAALAREYDGEDLLHEPWHLFLPLVASLATSFLLFSLVTLVGFHSPGIRDFWLRYRTFLGLYWMTAPLAWLYAVPVERFLAAGAATETNLWLLAVVSVWRVVLITRVLSVLLSASPLQIVFVVMLFADSIALLLVQQIDVQIFAVMGGVRLTDSERALAGAKMLVLFFGWITFPIWAIGTSILTGGHGTGTLSDWEWSSPPLGQSHLRWSLWAFAGTCLVLGMLPLPWTQTEQRLRGSVERDFRAGRYRELLATMSAHEREDLPPHWDPPPRIGARAERSTILDVVSAFSSETAPWVRQMFCDKLSAALGRNDYPMETLWTEAGPEKVLETLIALPEGRAILEEKQEQLDHLANFTNDSPRLRELLMQLARAPDPSVKFESPEDYNWAWSKYLNQLEQFEDRKLVLKHHEARLRKVLDDPQFTPEAVQERIRKLLDSPEPETRSSSD